MNAKKQTSYRGLVRGALGITLMLAGALLASPIHAEDPTPRAAMDLTAKATLLVGGDKTQSDPHVSGNSLVYFSMETADVHYYDISTGVDTAIPRGDLTYVDSMPDVNGNTVVFTRHANPHGEHIMYAPVMDGTVATPQELAPLSDPDAFPARQQSSIGGSTVAWEEFGGSNGSQIMVASLATPSAPALPLSSSEARHDWPGVSPDGSVVVWRESDNSGGRLYQATLNGDGTWTTRQLTIASIAPEGPSTDGSIVAYAASVAPFDSDIYWQPVAGGTENRLVLPGSQAKPHASGGVIAFASDPTSSGSMDLYVYDTHTGQLYQLTNTPGANEILNDMSVGADGWIQVVWAAPDSYGKQDIYGARFQLTATPLYATQALFDQGKSYKFGSVVPIRFQLRDGQGNNVSSASLIPTTTGLVQEDTAAASDVQDAGNSNPDSAFRYDDSLPGYVFNLSTKNLGVGTWDLQFTVPGDSTPYHILFDLK